MDIDQTGNENKCCVLAWLNGLEISYMKIQLKCSNPMNGNGVGRGMKMM